MSNPLNIAVLGGGITGLTAAYRLHKLGHRVRLFEQTPRLGGAIRTEFFESWLVEAGPNSFQETPGAVANLVRELDLESKRVEAGEQAKHRYIARGRSLVRLPLSPGAMLTGSFLSLSARFGLIRELLVPPPKRAHDLSVADFTRRHFGAEVLDHAVQPFVSGIYAGDPKKLSTRYAFPKLWEMEQRHGSLLRGQRAAAKASNARGSETTAPKIVSFRRGLQTLPLTLGAALPKGVVSLNARVDRLVPGEKWEVVWHDGVGPRTETFDRVVCALPALALSNLPIGATNERPLASLASIAHPPLSSLFLGFRRDQVSHPLDGFGALVPAIEKRSILGVVFSSSLFPHRAPMGHVALTVMIGGALQPELAAQSATQLLATIRRDLKELLGVTGEPVFQHHTFWPRAIPQYELGYEQHLATMAACEEKYPGCLIGGQVRDGISLPNCLEAGEKLAARAHSDAGA